MKVIHCADIHLKSIDEASGEERNRRAEIFRSYLRIITYCRNNGADVLLMAGDVLEDGSDTISAQKVIDSFADIPDTDIYICTGNHDPFMPDSAYRKLVWPDNVTIFGGNAEIIERPDKGYRIVGAGFNAPYVSRSLLSHVSLKRDELINLGIMHGTVCSEGAEGVYNPIYRSDIQNSNIDYLALGHIHHRSSVEITGKTAYAYCGNAEGRGFDECDEKGFYVVNISKEGGEAEINPAFVKTCIREYKLFEVDVSGTTTLKSACDKVLSQLEKLCGSDYNDNYCRIILRGTVGTDRNYTALDLQNILSDMIHFAEVKDLTYLQPDYKTLAEGNNLLGAFTRKMLKEIKDAELANDIARANQLKESLKLGVMAFSGEVSNDENQ